jgi:hypothetical protein
MLRLRTCANVGQAVGFRVLWFSRSSNPTPLRPLRGTVFMVKADWASHKLSARLLPFFWGPFEGKGLIS